MTQLGISQSSVGWSNYADKQQFVVVTDKLPGDMGGTGTDILTNVEFISFQDQFLPLAKEEFIDVDPNTGLEVRRYVNGTSAADTIEGGVGNDDLFGNGGNDTISGGIGGDYITPGKGDDIMTVALMELPSGMEASFLMLLYLMVIMPILKLKIKKLLVKMQMETI